MDKLVIDIETKNTFADVGGQANIGNLKISFVGLYSYNHDALFGFYENELDKLGPVLQRAGLLIGHTINAFDIPVLNAHFPFNLFAVPRVDLLEEVEMNFGRRVGLEDLARANLGAGKLGHGIHAVTLYRGGQLSELRDYCLQDVRLTRDLYERAMRQGYLYVPNRATGELVKVPLNLREVSLPVTFF
mgnify:CR=1 FL=1